MSTFTVLLLCFQACLVLNVLSYCSSRAGLMSAAPITSLTSAACGDALAPAASYAPLAYAPSFIAYGPGATAYSPAFTAAYGGSEGNVAIIGELPITSETALAGQGPIIGFVGFSGSVPGAGAVSIFGNCACGCTAI